MFKKLTCNQKWYLDPRGRKDGRNQEESLPTGVGEEGTAAERQITSDGKFADKPSLIWAREVEM